MKDVMRNWYLIENTRGDSYETKLTATTEAEAVDQAVMEWEKLSRHDQKERTEFFIGYAEEGEDGVVDLNGLTNYIDIREAMEAPSNLKRYRILRGLTQVALADKSIVNVRTIQDYEQKRKDINGMAVKAALRLARALQVDVEDLLED